MMRACNFLLGTCILPVMLLGVGMVLSRVVGPLVVQFRDWSPTAAVYTHSWQCRARDSNHCSLQNIYHLGIEAYSTSPCNNIVIIFGLGPAGVRVMVVSGRK